MSTTTTNYGLIKPDTTDPILIGQLNDNSDAIDAALKENADAIENKPDAADIPTPSTAAPAMDGTAAAGTSTDYARADHVHPSDTSKQDALSAAQLAAANSGIDSAKVEQIETNKNSFSGCKFYADASDKNSYTFNFTKRNATTSRYRYGLIIAGVSAAGMSIFSIFIDTSNNVTISPIAGTTTRTFTGTISYSGDTGTLTIVPSAIQYGGIRLIWFD